MNKQKTAIEFRTPTARVVMETLEVNESGFTRKIRIGFDNEETKKGVSIELNDIELRNFKILLGAL